MFLHEMDIECRCMFRIGVLGRLIELLFVL